MSELFDKLNTEAADEARVMTFPEEPVQENVPLKVWVVPAVKVIVCGAVKVRLLKVELPETACVAPLSTTAPSPVTAPPPDQLPDTLRLYEPRPSVPAVRVRLVAVAAPAKATVLPEALTVNVE